MALEAARWRKHFQSPDLPPFKIIRSSIVSIATFFKNYSILCKLKKCHITMIFLCKMNAVVLQQNSCKIFVQIQCLRRLNKRNRKKPLCCICKKNYENAHMKERVTFFKYHFSIRTKHERCTDTFDIRAKKRPTIPPPPPLRFSTEYKILLEKNNACFQRVILDRWHIWWAIYQTDRTVHVLCWRSSSNASKRDAPFRW